jgi:hypothetical protein
VRQWARKFGPTTGASSPEGDHREVTTHKEVDENGNAVTEKEIHREGVAASMEIHKKTETDREGGTMTRDDHRAEVAAAWRWKQRRGNRDEPVHGYRIL